MSLRCVFLGVCVFLFWVLFHFGSCVCLFFFLLVCGVCWRFRRSRYYALFWYKEAAISQPPEITLTTHSMHHPPRVHLLCDLDLPHERRVTATSSTHRLSSTTTPLHVDSGNLKTSEPKASEALCALITAAQRHYPESSTHRERAEKAGYPDGALLVWVLTATGWRHGRKISVGQCAG